MAATPTFSELFTGILNDLETQYGESVTGFGKVFLRALAAVQAAKMKLFWLEIAQVEQNIFVDTGDDDIVIRFGEVKLRRPPFGATQGLYSVDVTGTIGAIIPAGTTFKSNDDSTNPGKIFTLDAAFTLTSSTDTFQIRALEGGPDSRLGIGNKLTSTSPLNNVDDEITVSAEDSIPLEAEDIEEYRDKVIAAFQTEAQGGSAGDYRLWSSDAQGVQEVYPYAKSGECAEINLYVEATKVDSSDGFGTPTTEILADVESVVEFDPDTSKPDNERGRRPLGTFQIFFLPVDVKPVDINIINPMNIDVDTQAAIISALEELTDGIRPFVEAAEPLEKKNDILSVNVIISTIQGILTGNQTFDSVTLTVDAVAVPVSIQFTDGDIPYIQTVAFV